MSSYIVHEVKQYFADQLFGQTHSMFNLKGIIEDLPAANAFFWYDRVLSKDRPKYLKLLGKLITLFTLEHKFDMYPHHEPSYFKKYEVYFRDYIHMNDYVNQVFQVLAINTTTVEFDIPPDGRLGVNLDDETAEDLTQVHTLPQAVMQWYNNPQSKPIFILLMNIGSPTNNEGHATFLVLKKQEDFVTYIYFNPHGSIMDTGFSTALYHRLNTILPVQCLEVHTQCPLLQSSAQGGNCVQWNAMIICFLCLHPEYFQDPKPLFKELQKHPELNILIFSLSLFLRTLPFFKLSTFYYGMFTYYNRVPGTEQLRANTRTEALKESKNFNDWIYRRLHETNCSRFEQVTCPRACSLCNGTCAVTASVKFSESGDCHLLTPKEMAKEMFEIFFRIKKLTRTLGNEVDRLHLQNLRWQMYTFREAKTLQDYVDLGYMTQQEILNVL